MKEETDRKVCNKNVCMIGIADTGTPLQKERRSEWALSRGTENRLRA
jgi:hypothetical protein